MPDRIRATSWPLLFFVATAVSCVDGIPTDVIPGAVPIPVQFAVEPASNLSTHEQDALNQAFDQLDQLRIRLFRKGEVEPFIDTLVAVQPGQDEYSVDLTVPADEATVELRVDLVGSAGIIELFAAIVDITVQQSGGGGDAAAGTVGSDAVITLPVRYTGPGLRGLVLDPDGLPASDLGVDLLQDGTVVQSATTSADGEYLFTDLQAGTYLVRVLAAPGLVSCPAQREIGPLSATSKVVGGFKLSRTNCELKILVLSGGDVNDNGGVIGALAAAIPEATFSSDFVIVNPPSLNALLDYDAILLYENGTYEHATKVGDRLAQYVGAGGNLIIGSFYWQNRSDGTYGHAGWGALEGFDPFTSSGGAVYGSGTLGSVSDHPITNGVTALGAERWWGGANAKGGTSVVASWADGTPLAGFRSLEGGQRIIAISAFPGLLSQCCASGDFSTLWANAVRWAGGAGGPSRVSTVRLTSGS